MEFPGPSILRDAWLPHCSALISAWFLVSTPFRIWRLRGSPIKVGPSRRGWIKVTTICLLIILETAGVVLSVVLSRSRSELVVAASLSLASAIGLLCLIVQEHWRSIQPSEMAIAYLLARLACNALWLTLPAGPLQRATQLVILLQSTFSLVILGLECRSKSEILLDPYKQLPPEVTTSSLGRAFFSWINTVLEKGYDHDLVKDELPPLDRGLGSEALRRRALRAWDQRAKPEGAGTLPKVLIRCTKTSFFLAIIPRLLVVMFRFGQPILISRAIQFVSSASESQVISGYWIIIMAIVTYVGLSLSTSAYRHRLNRLSVMIRGSLLGLLHSSSLTSEDTESNQGKVVTLIGNDVSNLESSAEMFHEIWAQFLEVIVGIVLLAREVGWLWPLPLVIIFLCAQVSRYVAQNLKGRQGKWNVATQERMAMTSSVIASIKDIKMLGLQAAMEKYVQGLRQNELDAAKSVRWLMVGYNASANALGMFAPVLTIVMYAALAAWQGSSLDTETAFTTVAILGLVTHPANMVMTFVPRVVVALLSFSRIQSYLLESGIHDGRIQSIGPSGIQEASSRATSAFRLEGVAVTDPNSRRIILQDIDLDVPRGSVTICSGPVGSGKSILARTILGEVTPSSGSIWVASKHVAYCAQTPWLPNQSIRDIVYGPTPESNRDDAWYRKAIHSCCLDEDINMLPDGEQTIVGSRGMNLSGGQRQRVALARAVYARYSTVVLDDSFSALDGKTRNQVVSNLLGEAGILKELGTTVFWVENTTSYFHLADRVVILADSTIKEQGPWNELQSHAEEIDVLIHRDEAPNPAHEPKTARATPAKIATSQATPSKVGRRNGDLSLYSYYFRSAGVFNILLMVGCTATYGFSITFPQYWLKWWTERETSSTAFWITGYILLLLLAWAATNVQMWCTVLRIAPASGASLHQRLLAAIMGAPLLYFSETDAGTILNRFGQDIQLVDKSLAPALTSLFVQIFKLTMQAGLLIAVQYLMALTLPFCTVVVYMVQKVYLRTSRQLRLLELESRAAVYSSFLETVQGVATVRAFGWQKEAAASDSRHLDESQQPTYLLLCLQRWLNIVLSNLIAAIAVGTITLAVVLRGSTTGGQIGVALNLILVANATLLSLVTSWTNLEISLGSVARLKEVEEETPREDQGDGDFSPPDGWPSAGEVELGGVTAAYNSATTALQDLDLRITPGQTVVVCGRTGSGKSSLLLALLRLLDLRSGHVKVDGIDITGVPRHIVRSRAFIAVSQTPLILSGMSLRRNLDPNDEATPEGILGALRQTGLWAHYFGQTTDAASVLDQPVSSLPTLSAGQAQILALTRALVQARVAAGEPGARAGYSDGGATRPVVLLDEVTSSLDSATEAKIYDIIEENFVRRGHTVIMVTHKLGGFAGRMRPGRDRVVWMKDGRVEKIE